MKTCIPPQQGLRKSQTSHCRNTPEIARLALEIAKLGSIDTGQEAIVLKPSVAAGPKPFLFNFSKSHKGGSGENSSKQLDWITQIAYARAKSESVAILAISHELLRVLHQAKDGVKAETLDGEMASCGNRPGLWIGAYDSARGLEFDTVFLPFLDGSNIPNADYDHRKSAKLLYVVVMSARDRLIMTYDGKLTELLPQKPELYQRRGWS